MCNSEREVLYLSVCVFVVVFVCLCVCEQKLAVTTNKEAEKRYFEVTSVERPPFRFFLKDSDCDEPLWSASINEGNQWKQLELVFEVCIIRLMTHNPFYGKSQVIGTARRDQIYYENSQRSSWGSTADREVHFFFVMLCSLDHCWRFNRIVGLLGTLNQLTSGAALGPPPKV